MRQGRDRGMNGRRSTAPPRGKPTQQQSDRRPDDTPRRCSGGFIGRLCGRCIDTRGGRGLLVLLLVGRYPLPCCVGLQVENTRNCQGGPITRRRDIGRLRGDDISQGGYRQIARGALIASVGTELLFDDSEGNGCLCRGARQHRTKRLRVPARSVACDVSRSRHRTTDDR